MALDIGKLVGYIELDDKQADEVMGKFPDKIKGMGTKGLLAAAGVGVAVAAALGKGVANAINFEQVNHKLAASLGLTADESAKAGKVAGELYANNYGDSMDEVSAAVGDVMSSIKGMRDASSKDVQDVTKDVLNMAKAFGVDTADAAKIVGEMLSTGLVKNAKEGTDLLTKAFQKVPAGVRGDLVDALDEYSPFFQQIGFKGEDAMNVLVQASAKGMYGIDKTGDALKEFTIRSTDMSTTSVAAYKTLGLNAHDMANKILAGGDTAKGAFQTIVKGIEGIKDPATRSNTAIALFGTQMEDLGVGEVPKFLDSMLKTSGALGDTKGAADKMGDSLNGGVANGVATMQRQFEMMMAGVGSTLLPFLNGILTWANENPAAMQIVAVALGILALAFLGVTVATWAMNTALLANPITWVIIGIVALIAAIVLLIANWDAVVKFMADVWGGFVGWFMDGLNAFMGWWNDLWTGFAGFVTDVWNGFIGFIVDVWNGFVGFLSDSITNIVNWVKSNWGLLLSFIIGPIGLAIQWVVEHWSQIMDVISSVITNVVNWTRSTLNGFVSWWNGLWNGVVGFIASVWNGIVSTVSGAVNGVISFITGIPGKVINVFTSAGTMLYDIGRNIIDGLLRGLKSMWDNLVSWVSGIGGGIIDTFKNILGIHSPSKVFEGFGVNIGQGLINGLDKMQPEIDSQVKAMVTVPATPDSAKMVANNTSNTTNEKHFTYVAAPGSSLSTEEELFDALSRPRNDF